MPRRPPIENDGDEDGGWWWFRGAGYGSLMKGVSYNSGMESRPCSISADVSIWLESSSRKDRGTDPRAWDVRELGADARCAAERR